MMTRAYFRLACVEELVRAGVPVRERLVYISVAREWKSLGNSGKKQKREKLEEELKKYKNLPFIDRNEDPIVWWKTNTTIFPNIRPFVLKYLSKPPSSVASEKQFSTAGDIYKETRSRLTVDNADRLIFIMKNRSHL